jgi:hypothetical protein
MPKTKILIPSQKDIMEFHRQRGLTEFETKCKEFFDEVRKGVIKKNYKNTTCSETKFHNDSTIATFTVKKDETGIQVKILYGKVFVSDGITSDSIRCLSICGTVEAINKILSEK